MPKLKFRTEIKPDNLIGVGPMGGPYEYGISSHTGYIEIDNVDTEVLYVKPCEAPELIEGRSPSADCYRVLSRDRVVFIEED